MHPRTVSEIIAAKFTDCVRRAVSCQLSAIEVIAAAEELTRCNESALARELYKLWIAHNPADPLLHAINFNYGVLLNESGQLADAQAAFTTAIEARPDFLSPYINLGTLLERAGNLDEAVKCWLEVVNRLPTVTADALKHKTVALKQMGRVLEANGRPDQAEAMFQACLDLNPNQRDVLQHWIAVRQTQCKWPVLAPWGSISSSMVMQALSPLSAAILIDDPVLQLANAWHYYRQDIASSLAQTTAGGWPTSGARGSRRLRIGYVSSDLREHAIGFLTAELFELHDRTNVEVLAYYCGPRTEDELQQRIRRAVDHWIDISDLTDQQAASRIVEDGIDILVDVNGYTKDARLKLFSLRPAPIIVNWLGFPGSMATPHHNYIIADQTIIPPDAERFYSEKIMRLPCYQPNDR
ncbi:MAG: tetratricopeptide repeat protein, partial [Acetobacteraceae bacterium]|nr:tetratricopeptide repeat protein [Acetobacteraceae bacterium]